MIVIGDKPERKILQLEMVLLEVGQDGQQHDQFLLEWEENSVDKKKRKEKKEAWI